MHYLRIKGVSMLDENTPVNYIHIIQYTCIMSVYLMYYAVMYRVK